MAATMRAKKFIINDLYTQMKSHGLTSSCTYNEYLQTVGASDAVHPRAIAKGWRGRWTVVMSQLKNYYPDIDEVINVVVEEPKIDLSGLEALRALSANKEEEDGKDF
jgi:uncharacterized protein YjlB